MYNQIWKMIAQVFPRHIIAAAASEPEANERGSSLIIIGACHHLFLLNARNCGYAQVEDLGCAVVCRKELWLCTNRRFRMRNCMPQGIVVMCEWEDLGCAAYQSHKGGKFLKKLWCCVGGSITR